MVRIQSRTNILSVLVWVQTVCKGSQQTTKVAAGKERVKYSPAETWEMVWRNELDCHSQQTSLSCSSWMVHWCSPLKKNVEQQFTTGEFTVQISTTMLTSNDLRDGLKKWVGCHSQQTSLFCSSWMVHWCSPLKENVEQQFTSEEFTVQISTTRQFQVNYYTSTTTSQ